MRKLWDWFRGTSHVWIEMEVIDRVECAYRKVHIRPFGGIYAYHYESIQHGTIRLTADGKGTCDTGYTKILRWMPANNRPLRAKYQMALVMGEVDRKWEGDK